MKLKPPQIIGLISIVLAGGILVSHPIQTSEPEFTEGRLASFPLAPQSHEAPFGAACQVAPAPASTSGIAIEPDDSMPGSQEAKDYLYCWAVLGAEFDVRIKSDPEGATPLLAAARRLEAAGVTRLEAEGVTNRDNWASLAVTYAEKARTDYRRNTLRIPVAACSDRASDISSIDHP